MHRNLMQRNYTGNKGRNCNVPIKLSLSGSWEGDGRGTLYWEQGGCTPYYGVCLVAMGGRMCHLMGLV